MPNLWNNDCIRNLEICFKIKCNNFLYQEHVHCTSLNINLVSSWYNPIFNGKSNKEVCHGYWTKGHTSEHT